MVTSPSESVRTYPQASKMLPTFPAALFLPMMPMSSGPAMNSLAGHYLILARAAAAIPVMSFFVDWPQTTAPVQTTGSVVVSERRNEPSNLAPLTQLRNVPVPKDIATLTREIQRELKRIGCYDGDIHGRWNAQSRQAMKIFTDYVNAKLPIERPDYILLRLAQGHQGKVCGPAESTTLRPASPSLLYEGQVPKGGSPPN
jgi:hypothetical protein